MSGRSPSRRPGTLPALKYKLVKRFQACHASGFNVARALFRLGNRLQQNLRYNFMTHHFGPHGAPEIAINVTTRAGRNRLCAGMRVAEYVGKSENDDCGLIILLIQVSDPFADKRDCSVEPLLGVSHFLERIQVVDANDVHETVRCYN